VSPSTPDDGFDRRSFLLKVAIGGGVAWAVPAVTTIGLSRATATPCPAGVAAQEVIPDVQAEMDARSPRTHTTCYQRCMEDRVAREVEAANVFDACLIKAGDNEANRLRCAERYRSVLLESRTQFKGCIGACS
jgi:hypothetical protein